MSVLEQARSDSPTPAVMTIAGSDSGGGAGIQADLKAFAAVGVHGTSAITAITAQSTVGVTAVHAIPPAIIGEQVATVAADIELAAVKIGMLGTTETIEAVSAALDLLSPVPIVLDPVMVAESGAELLDPQAREALRELMLPRADVVTPNIPEARVLARMPAGEGAALAAGVRSGGAGAALVTGGHGPDGADLLDDGAGEPLLIPGPVHPDGAAHGSGCTHSATLAALLACGVPLREAAVRAREVAAEAIGRGLREVGAGPGPVDVIGLAARR